MVIVYGLKDPISNKLRYVGITKRTLKSRLSGHLSKAKNSKENYHRLTWLRSLLKKNLKPIIFIIEICEEDMSQNREIYWIRYFKKKGCNLTNGTIGGEGTKGHKWKKEQYNKRSKKVCQYDKKGNLINTFNSIKDAARFFDREDQDGKISQVCQGKYGRKTFMGFVWRYEEDPFDKYECERNTNYNKSKDFREFMRHKQLGKNNPMSKSVIQYDFTYNVIKIWDTLKQAAESINVSSPTLSKYIRLKKLYKESYWEFN